MSAPTVYDDLIPFFGYEGMEWPQMRLFLNMVKDNYYSSENKAFPIKSGFIAKYYPEADSQYYVDPNDNNSTPSAADGVASKQFQCFLKEWMQYLGGTAGSTLVPLSASGASSVSTAGWTVPSAARGPTGAGVPAPTQNFAAFKDVLKSVANDEKKVWFLDFAVAIIDTITTPGAGTAPATTTKIDAIQKLKDVVKEGNYTSVTFKGRDAIDNDLYLKALFDKVTVNNAETGRVWEPTDAQCSYFRGLGKQIGFKFDKYTLKFLLDQALKSNILGASTTFFDSVGTTPSIENKYYRKPGDKANIYTEINGKETAVSKGSEEFMKLVSDNNCFNLGIQVPASASKTECTDFVMKCLGGKDIDECKSYMLNNSFWKNVDQELKSMNPDMALEVLSKFGFPTYETEVAEVGLKLKMFGNTTQWLETLKNNQFPSPAGNRKFSDADIKSISSNRELIGYLDAVSAMVNRNPGILNSGYAKGQLSSNVNAFAGTQLSAYGLKGKYTLPGSGVPSVSSIVALQNAVMQNRSAVAVYYGIPFNTTGYSYVLRGGGASVDYFTSAQNPNVAPIRLSTIMEEHIKGFETALKGVNKDLADEDKASIKKLISDLKTTEDKLFKSAIYTSKYIDLLSVFGQEDTNGLITLDHLQQFVDKRNTYFEKVGTKSDTIMTIAKTFAEAVQKELNLPASTSVAAYPTPKN